MDLKSQEAAIFARSEDYTRGVQDATKAVGDKWAARCARAETKVAELQKRIMELYDAARIHDGFLDD